MLILPRFKVDAAAGHCALKDACPFVVVVEVVSELIIILHYYVAARHEALQSENLVVGVLLSYFRPLFRGSFVAPLWLFDR